MIAVATDSAACPSAATTKFWDAKSYRVRADAQKLAGKNPALLAVLTLVSYLAWEMFQKKVTITSIERTENDPNKLHRLWRAIDLRVAIDGALTMAEWARIDDIVNHTFNYGRTWRGKKTKVLHMRGGGTVSEPVAHVHIQVPRFSWR